MFNEGKGKGTPPDGKSQGCGEAIDRPDRGKRQGGTAEGSSKASKHPHPDCNISPHITLITWPALAGCCAACICWCCCCKSASLRFSAFQSSEAFNSASFATMSSFTSACKRDGRNARREGRTADAEGKDSTLFAPASCLKKSDHSDDADEDADEDDDEEGGRTDSNVALTTFSRLENLSRLRLASASALRTATVARDTAAVAASASASCCCCCGGSINLSAPREARAACAHTPAPALTPPAAVTPGKSFLRGLRLLLLFLRLRALAPALAEAEEDEEDEEDERDEGDSGDRSAASGTAPAGREAAAAGEKG